MSTYLVNFSKPVIAVDVSEGPAVVILPVSPADNARVEIIDVNGFAKTFGIDISTAGDELISGKPKQYIDVDYGSINIRAIGGQYFIV